jgi:hypothetical protein
MTDLMIKLSSLYHEKFEKKGHLTKLEQSNWDKWFSDYVALDGNSDVRRMDDIIQKARVQCALDKSSGVTSKVQQQKPNKKHEGSETDEN